jgi:2-methylisocitrate lyase-like PEP mutase family enzyme
MVELGGIRTALWVALRSGSKNVSGLIAVVSCILLLARTDVRVSRGFDEALARIQAFVAEEAHILFLDAPQSEDEMRASIAACNGRPALAVTSPAGKHFMPGNAELERIGIRIVVYPQDILAGSVKAIRAALGGLKGGAKPAVVSPAELAKAISSPPSVHSRTRWRQLTTLIGW